MIALARIIVSFMLGAGAGAALAGTPLTFADAISRAPGASSAREQAQAELEASAARRSEAKAGYGPKLHGSYTQARFDKDVEVAFGPEPILLRSRDLRQGSLELSQPLSGLFVTHAAAVAAKSREDASAAALDAAKASAAFEAATAYLDAQEAEELLRLAETAVQASDSQSKDADALSKSGRIIRSDQLKISIAAQDAKAQLARARARQKKAHDRLMHAVGLPEGSDVTLDPLPSAAAASALAPATAGQANTRPDVRRAQLDAEAAEHEAKLVKYKFAPSVNAFVKWDRIYSEPPFGNPPFTRTVGVAASWDLWDNGTRVYESHEAEARSKKSAAALAEAKDQARLQIDGLVADVTAAKEALAAAQASVDQAEEAYRLDKARFGTGLETATDLLLSEATRTKARATFVTTLVQVSRLALDLQRAGGADTPVAPIR